MPDSCRIWISVADARPSQVDAATPSDQLRGQVPIVLAAEDRDCRRSPLTVAAKKWTRRTRDGQGIAYNDLMEHLAVSRIEVVARTR